MSRSSLGASTSQYNGQDESVLTDNSSHNLLDVSHGSRRNSESAFVRMQLNDDNKLFIDHPAKGMLCTQAAVDVHFFMIFSRKTSRFSRAPPTASAVRAPSSATFSHRITHPPVYRIGISSLSALNQHCASLLKQLTIVRPLLNFFARTTLS